MQIWKFLSLSIFLGSRVSLGDVPSNEVPTSDLRIEWRIEHRSGDSEVHCKALVVKLSAGQIDGVQLSDNEKMTCSDGTSTRSFTNDNAQGRLREEILPGPFSRDRSYSFRFERASGEVIEKTVSLPDEVKLLTPEIGAVLKPGKEVLFTWKPSKSMVTLSNLHVSSDGTRDGKSCLIGDEDNSQRDVIRIPPMSSWRCNSRALAMFSHEAYNASWLNEFSEYSLISAKELYEANFSFSR